MTTIRVYQYGLRPPTAETAGLVREQLKRAHIYRNKLVEIERKLRAKRRELTLAHAPDFAAAAAELEQAVRLEETARAAMMKTASSPEAKATLAEAKSRTKDVRQRLKDARAQLRGNLEFEAAVAAALDQASVDRKTARAECGVYWGTYLLVEAAVEQACRPPGPDGTPTAMPLWSFRDGVKPLDPPFLRFTGEGTLGVQCQRTYNVTVRPDGLPSENTLVQVLSAPPAPGADPKSRRSALRRRVILRMRAGSSGPANREPVWVEWPMLLHRPLPAGALVKYITVRLEQSGPREANQGRWTSERWTAQVTVELPEGAALRHAPTTGCVGVDLGWRATERGLRVGYASGSDGQELELLVPEPVLGHLAKADSLRSTRDKSFNVIRDALAEWWKTRDHAAFGVAVAPHWAHWFKNASPLVEPQWTANLERIVGVRGRAATLALWRSPQRLHDLVAYWGQNRFAADAAIFPVLHAWSEHDRHLWAWETGARRKALLRRRDGYRVLARRLADTYATLVLSDVDFATTKEAFAGTAATSQHFKAAPGELRQALVNAFAGRVVYAPGGFATDSVTPSRQCWSCGTIDTDWSRANLEHTCSGCGLRWDQDVNAARCLRQYAGDSVRDARTTTNSWAAAKAAKKAKVGA